MNYALTKVKPLFPLSAERYQNLSFDDLNYLDQLIFRFSKLQDSMGNRLFPAILENMGEDIHDKPFIVLLNRMEKLSLLESHKQWLLFRETRNEVSQELSEFQMQRDHAQWLTLISQQQTSQIVRNHCRPEMLSHFHSMVGSFRLQD